MGFDTVVIGSGPGGLTAAVALARAGQRVLVLEQHYLPGGWTHSFTLEGYRFSPGVHYIGDLGPGGGMRRLVEGLGLSEHLEFNELNPDGFDHLLIAGERFDVPKGYDRYIDRLLARFPHEREGILRYFGVINQLVADVKVCESRLELPALLTIPFHAPSLLRWGFRTLGALLDATIKDPMLRAVLSAIVGDHGLAPSRVSLPLHAAMTSHYYEGGYYPRGGAKKIPNAYIKQLRRHGGEIRMRSRVRRILVEKNRACGVELEDGTRIDAGHVISNADPALTYGKLLPPEMCKRQRRKADRMEYSVSLISIFCAVDMDLRSMGYDSGNYWWYRTADVGGLYERTEHELPGDTVDGLFLTVTTLKDPGHQKNGHHTLEMFTFVPYAPFERWRGTPDGARGPDYQALKTALADKMLAAAENVIPGVRSAMKFLAVGSPLTNDFYCETHRGAAYGTAKTPWQLGPFSFSITSPVERLSLVGASTISHGVAGAAMSGLIAAKDILGHRTVEECLGPADGSLRIHPADRPEEWLQAPKPGELAEAIGEDDELEEVA
jgi:all-trans-retinol 13,14-reductase